MQCRHNTQIVAGNGKHAKLLVVDKGVGVEESQTHIGHVHGIELFQAVEGLRVYELNGAVGNLNGGHILQAQLLKELGGQQYWVFGTNIGHYQIGNVRAKLLGSGIQSAARGHQVTVDVPRADTVSRTGHILTEHNLLIVCYCGRFTIIIIIPEITNKIVKSG